MLSKLKNLTLIILSLLLLIIFVGAECSRVGDFYIYLKASANLFSTPNLYQKFYGVPEVFTYLGNPFLTLVLHPFTFISIQSGAIIWKVFNILLLYRVWLIIEQFLADLIPNKRALKKWLILSFLASFYMIYGNLHLVQFTIVLLYLSLEALYQIIEKERPIIGAALLSLAVLIKVSPIVLLPYLLYRKQLLAFFLVCAFGLLYFLFPVLFVGWEKSMTLWAEWWNTVSPDAEGQIFDMNNRKNHGISTLFSTLFIKDITDNIITIETRRFLFDLGREGTKYLIYGARAFFVIFTLYFMGTKPFTKTVDKLKEFWGFSYLLMIIPLFFPQQRLYNFIFLLPAIAYLIADFLAAKPSKIKLVLFILAIIVLNLDLLLGQYRHYYWHFKTVTYASTILVVLFALTKPKAMNPEKTEEI